MPPRPPSDPESTAARRRVPAAPPVRRMRGFEPAASLVAERIRAAGQSRGFAMARVLTHWAEIVGPEIARVTRPVKLGHAARRGEGGLGATLTLLVAPGHSPVVQMQIPRIVERVNACYGHAAISRIALTQAGAGGRGRALGGFSEGPAPFSGPAPEAPADPPGPRALAAAEGVRDDALREALARLATRVLADPPGPATPPAARRAAPRS